jgi:hypothetical protein
MKCPECGSKDDVIKLKFNEHLDNPYIDFKERYSFLFEYSVEDENTRPIIEALVGLWSAGAGLISLAGICGLLLGGANAFIVITLGISALAGLFYAIGGNNIKENNEESLITKIKGENYCESDDIFFGRSGKIDDERGEIEEQLTNFYLNIRPWAKRVFLVSSLFAVSAIVFINTPWSNRAEENNTKNIKKEAQKENLISERISGVGEISSNPSFLYDGDINGKYSFPVGEGLDISVVFVTWDKLENINAKISEERRKEYSDHDGLFYAYEGGSKGMLLGAWKLSNRMIDGFRKKFVFINTAKFRDGSLGDKDIGILYGEGEGPSLGIHVRGNRFFSAYPKKDLPRNRSFYAD